LGTQSSVELGKLADLFTSRLPEMDFSPAEVQGYLITRKKDPQSAVAQVEAWRDAKLAKNEEKKESQKERERKRRKHRKVYKREIGRWNLFK
jgi:mitochondrial chaperone BCS1